MNGYLNFKLFSSALGRVITALIKINVWPTLMRRVRSFKLC